MRNTSFFEKLTGSLRLSDDDLKALNDTHTENDTPSTATQTQQNTPQTSQQYQNDDDTEVIVEESEGDFDIPDDAEIETIEEVVEDDTIDSEQVDEYYEEVIDEEVQPEAHEEATKPVDETFASFDEDAEGPDEEEEDAEVSSEAEEDGYPIFNLESEEEPEDEEQFDVEPEEDETMEPEAKPRLPIDMYELHHEIIIRTLVPGITPENLKVSITRDHVSIAGTRPAPDGIPNKNYFEREVEWGEFSRVIELPTEVDVEHAEAVEKYGLLVIRLPKMDSKKTQELKVKSV